MRYRIDFGIESSGGEGGGKDPRDNRDDLEDPNDPEFWKAETKT